MGSSRWIANGVGVELFQLAIHYAMSRQGSKVQSSDPGSVEVFDPVGLPKEYQSPTADTPGFYEQINTLLST